MNTTYDTRPEIMRLLKLFGEFRIFYRKENDRLEPCTYWRGYCCWHSDMTLHKPGVIHERP